MVFQSPVRTGLLLAAAALGPCFAHAAPNDMGTVITAPGQSNVSQQVTLGLNKSLIIDLENPAALQKTSIASI